jgi:hypothetical protein
MNDLESPFRVGGVLTLLFTARPIGWTSARRFWTDTARW